MAGEEPGKMPELYVEALLKNTDSVSSLRLQCKAKEIYSQRLPKWHLNCTGNLNSQKMLKIGCKHMIICNRLWMSGSARTRPRYVGRRRKQFELSSFWIARESGFERIKEH